MLNFFFYLLSYSEPSNSIITLFCIRTTMKAKLRVISFAEQVYIPLFRTNIRKFSPTFINRKTFFIRARRLQSLLIPVLNARLTQSAKSTHIKFNILLSCICEYFLTSCILLAYCVLSFCFCLVAIKNLLYFFNYFAHFLFISQLFLSINLFLLQKNKILLLLLDFLLNND